MKRYEKYKPSGVDWIGEVPNHWMISRVKNICTIHGRIGFRGYTVADLVQDEADGAITLSPTNIIDGKLDFSDCTYLSWAKYYESPEIMVKEGDLIFVKTASVGKSALVEYLPKETTVNPQIVVFKNIKCFGKFLDYFFKTQGIQSEVTLSSNGSTISTISQGAIGAYRIALPPLPEQIAIATYLDAKCAKIDNVVAVQQKRIELLKELKQSIITHAVTRGLDKNAKLKDSGVEWIGEVPEGWKVMKLKRVLIDYQDGTHGTFARVASDYPLLSAKNVFDEGIIISENESTISEKDYKSIISNGFPKKGDIAICCVGTIGRCCIYTFDEPYAFQRSVTFLRVNNNMQNAYLTYVLRSEIANAQYIMYAKTSAQSGIYMESLVNFLIIVPPLSEQTAIIAYLDKKCAIIDNQIAKVERQIELLKEYKQSVITECVTGKRKVC